MPTLITMSTLDTAPFSDFMPRKQSIHLPNLLAWGGGLALGVIFWGGLAHLAGFLL